MKNNNDSERNDNEFPIPAKHRPKFSGWDFYNKVLGAPKLVVSILNILFRYIFL